MKSVRSLFLIFGCKAGEIGSAGITYSVAHKHINRCLFPVRVIALGISFIAEDFGN